MSEIAGIDFSMARPAPQGVADAGFRFVMGYVSNSPSKNLTAQNLRDYLAAGLSVGLVWETTADRALEGAGAGAADGAAADQQADAIGYPADCVIFFAVDEAVTVAQINGPIRAYAAAFNAAMKRPGGVYGSFLVVDTLVTPGQPPVQYGWQTAAWSSGNLSPKAHLYQRATPSGRWPVLSGTDENVLCAPLPLANSEGDDMPYTPQQIHDAVWGSPGISLTGVEGWSDGEWPYTTLGSMLARIRRDIIAPAVAELEKKIAAAPTAPSVNVDPVALAQALLADQASITKLGDAIAAGLANRVHNG